MSNNHKALIVDPNSYLQIYQMIPSVWQIEMANTIEAAHLILQKYSPDIVFISSSYSLNKSVAMLETIRNLSAKQLIPVIFVLNFTNKINHIPGTTWGGKIGILHTLSSYCELESTLHRVLS